ncbi:DUF6113 family protein [Actinomadura harenae]|uniref:Integral membrane protein n=1 Tax=Actinomadura harenae TaxID=2483351 RepID=A0A3M2LN39_9ACTN|nr:DUF6113 family protein [Actinomadura harenae]RMI38871.1 hypothetical protein EBO15_31325 [Actinomadura harenae]
MNEDHAEDHAEGHTGDHSKDEPRADRPADTTPASAPSASAPSASAPTASAPAAESGLSAVVSGAAYMVLALLGFAYGLFGAFHQNWTVGSWPLPAVGLCVVLFALVFGAGFGMGTKLGAVAPATTWMVVTFVMSTKQSEGDLVIPGTTPGYVYLIGGMVAALIAIAVVPTRRASGEWLTGQWLTGGGGDTRG